MLAIVPAVTASFVNPYVGILSVPANLDLPVTAVFVSYIPVVALYVPNASKYKSSWAVSQYIKLLFVTM